MKSAWKKYGVILSVLMLFFWVLPLAAASPVALGPGDLVVTIMGSNIDLRSADKNTIKLPQGGLWQEDEDGSGSSYIWTGGAMHFRGSKLDKLYCYFDKNNGESSFNDFRTARQLLFGTTEKKVKDTYPPASKTWTDDGIKYMQFDFGSPDTESVLLIGFSRLNGATFDSVSEIGVAMTNSSVESSNSDAQSEDHGFSYYDGFTWNPLSNSEKLQLCERIATAFASQKIMALKGKTSDMVKFLNKAYGPGSDDFQDSPISLLARQFKITNQSVIEKVQGMQ